MIVIKYAKAFLVGSLITWSPSVLHANPEMIHPEQYYNQGVSQSEEQNWEAAKQSFLKALEFEVEPELLQKIYYNLGTVVLHLNEPKDAISQFQNALVLQQDDPAAQHNLALAYQRLKDQQDQQDQEQESSDQQQQDQQDQQDQEQESSDQNEQSQQDQESSDQQQQNEKSQQNEQDDQGQQGQQNQQQSQEGSEQDQQEGSVGKEEESAMEELSKQQALQLLRSVNENRDAFIRRQIQRQDIPDSPHTKKW